MRHNAVISYNLIIYIFTIIVTTIKKVYVSIICVMIPSCKGFWSKIDQYPITYKHKWEMVVKMMREMMKGREVIKQEMKQKIVRSTYRHKI